MIFGRFYAVASAQNPDRLVGGDTDLSLDDLVRLRRWPRFERSGLYMAGKDLWRLSFGG